MAKILECNGSAFRDLKNPYTGEKIVVKMMLREGKEPLFFAPDTYDTEMRQPSAKSAFDNWNRVDGVIGLRNDGVSGVKCAYTGQPLVQKKDGQNFWFEGGFNPTHFFTRSEFLRLATMRDGKPTVEVPDDKPVEKPTEHAPAPKFHETQITDAAMSAAIDLAKKAGKRRK